MPDFAHKCLWIIGASSGIGRALAQELSRRGATLFLSARRVEALKSLSAEITGAHYICPMDIRDLEDVQNATRFVQENCTTLDSVINLAALYDPCTLENLDIATTRLLIDVNLMGTFNLIHTTLPILRAQGHGQMALCGSVAGFKGLPGGQPYSATKAAMINVSESLKAENPNLDIKIINPGFVRTPMTDQNDFAMPMIIEPGQAAKAIADGLLKRTFEIHFPKKFTFLIKLLRIIPDALYFRLARRLKRMEK